MKKIFLLVLLSCGVLFAQQEEFSLEESVITGLKNSKLLKLTESNFTAAHSALKEVNSLFYPRLNLTASYSRLSDVKSFEVSIPGAIAPIKIQDPVLNNYSLSLKLTQPIFTGFRLSSARGSAVSIKESYRIENENQANIVSVNIHRAFWNFNKSKKVKILIEKRLESIERHLHNTKLFLKSGLATTNDVLKLEVLQSDTKLKLIDAENNITLARTIFNRELGIDLSTSSDVKVLEVKIPTDNYLFEDLLDEAIEKRLELKSMQYKINAAENNIDVAQANWYPTISAFASFNYDNPNQRIMPLEEKFYDSWSVGIQLNWELWNWGETSAKSEQARIKLQQVKINTEILKENIETEIYKNYLKHLSCKQKLEVSIKQVEQATENLKILKSKYDQQLATSTDLIDAEVSILEAGTNKIVAEIDLKIAEVELKKAAGRKTY